MSRNRPKTFLFSELAVAGEDRVEDYVSQQAAPYDRTAKRRPGRPLGKRALGEQQDLLWLIKQCFANNNTDEEIAEALDVPVRVVSEYRRSL